mmetsp:Transcript_22175/g.45570  ORF Transcript_22175/g.45570 Transcript_22175/m.45570 type:complete len:330 (+) Transcript_22175:675-1664(+)
MSILRLSPTLDKVEAEAEAAASGRGEEFSSGAVEAKYLVVGALDPLAPCVGQRKSGELRLEIDRLTNRGTLIEAVVATHPFHTLGFEPFFAIYGGSGSVSSGGDGASSGGSSARKGKGINYYGTPRHLRRLRSIPWVGDVSDPAVQRRWEGFGVQMRLPAGTEFADPKPAELNHLSNLFVYHRDSKCLHNDDCLCYYDQPAKKMGKLVLALNVRHDLLAFHQSFTGVGLTDPLAFQGWLQRLVEDWPFECLCTAHNGRLFRRANARVRELLVESRDKFASMAAATPSIGQGFRVLSETEKRAGAWSPGSEGNKPATEEDSEKSNRCECG